MTYLASLTEAIEDKLEGYYFIKTRQELNLVVADTTTRNKVIIRRDFAREFFTPSGLQTYIENARHVNKALLIEVDEKSDVLTEQRFIEKLSRASNDSEMLRLLVKYPKEFTDTVHQLIENQNAMNEELLSASNAVSSLHSIVDRLNNEKEALQDTLETERMGKLQVQTKLDLLVKRINYQYNKGIDDSQFFTVSDDRYDQVLYFKELSRVQYTDTFIYELKEILRLLYNMPTRVVVIEPYYSTAKIKMYPHLVCHHELTERNVLYDDILMLGMQPKLMGDILKNPSNVSFLIVLDRAGLNDVHIKGENVEYFYIASDPADVPKSIPSKRVISYGEDNLFIPFVEGFEELDPDERIAKYSSMGITKGIVSLLEGK